MKKKKMLTDRTCGLDDSIANEISKEIQNEIDFGIICSMYKELGWTEVKIDWPRMTENLAHEIKEWNLENLKGVYHGRGPTWLFEKEHDATMFILKWA